MADIRINPSDKTFTIVVAGFAKDSSNFVSELNHEVSKVIPSNYDLIVDAEHMRTFSPQVLETLKQAYALYMSYGFRRIVMLSPEKATPRLQLKRMAKECNFTGHFVKGRLELKEYLANAN